ncbi:MAG: hypothetical protein GY833_15790 [Aestuariibacter sp.]|nr:hypothetical protein [Aestuariibacter sp.]
MTRQQQKALHLYFKLIAEQFREIGMPFRYHLEILNKYIELPHTGNIVKEFVWRPIQLALFDIKSTKDITTQQVNEIVNVMNVYFGEKGYDIQFPSIESFMFKMDKQKYNGK